MITWHFTESLERYVAHAWSFLAQRSAESTVLLTLIEDLRLGSRWSGRSMRFGWCEDGTGIQGAVIMTGPDQLAMSEMPVEAVGELVDGLHREGIAITEANGDSRTVDAFAARRASGARLVAVTAMRERLYRLGTLHVPPPPPGSARPATDQDRRLLLTWFDQFQRDAGLPGRPVEAWVGDQLDDRRLLVWQDGDEVVALAGRHRTAAGVARIGPVYTPLGRRGHGYGTAITVACLRDALDRDAQDVVLLADLANPTSNAIYQRIGFRPVADHVFVEFVPR